MRFFVGSYSIPSPWTGTPDGHGAGITAGELTGTSPILDPGARWEVNPSFLVAEPTASRLWAITEPEHGGELLCYDVGADGALGASAAARSTTGGDAPCHLALSPAAAFVSHYHGGTVTVIGRDEGGLPDRVLQTIALPVDGDGWSREGLRSRPHSVALLPGGEFAVADCGRDTVCLYHWDPLRRTAELRHALALPEGTGPRHLARDPRSGNLLVSDQNRAGVTVIARRGGPDAARLEHVQTLETRGLGRDRVMPSEIAIRPGGGLAVMANRFDDSLGLYAIGDSGALAEIATVDSGGSNPRHFAFTPDGALVIVAHKGSDELTVLRVERRGLSLAGSIPVATPTAIACWR